MKLIILRDNLKNGLAAVERIVMDNAALPVLRNIFIDVDNGKMKISATNLEIGINKFINCKIIEKGKITVPLNALRGIISHIDSERVNLETIDQTLIIKTDSYQANLQGIKADEFPIIPQVEAKEGDIEMDGGVLKQSLSEIVSAAHISEIRPEISGVLFDFQITILKLVATDIFRLAEKTLYDYQFKTSMDRGFKAIIPLKTIQEIIRMVKDGENVRIKVDENQILFESDNQEIISRLIDGQYPDYEQIIPKTIETELITDRDKFMNAVKLVSSVSDKVVDIKLRAKESGKVLEIYSANHEVGENSYLVPIKTNGLEFKEITFNWRYLIDSLKVLQGEEVFLGLNGDNRPTIVKAVNEKSYHYLLMPLKNE
ncbi:MAG: DNA polymerase III subunit beta [Candidatus Harrisonbacteria bacterium CG10_big_fil_rev_8_21_14_0_10_40_38]|uniref:Beta sliding clamp n=1 Tax=Candidatus Harrisonbacteria bacterium CG10_big_fil_rev_8_21_14_0_10_40_38 TaxID=1974583 RepID=A0A2H0URD6_9BACT|nr:MAG: DNA polymerase III subunit beta [Candidatus Harrisonbacteria bacterium CG10_big_fil_rev_8_21_14_0_10_40_38]